MIRVLFAGLWIVLCPVAAIAREPFIGNDAFLRPGGEARLNGAPVDIKTIRTLPYPLTVEKFDGEWAWVGTAWVRKKDLMLPMEAVEVYTEQIELHPKDAWLWRNRGSAWQHVHEYPPHVPNQYENAIKDFTEAIRLDPNFADAYTGRATARPWGVTGTKDLVIKDCTQAIRLDPNNALAFNLRGMNWKWKGDLEQALGDYTQAIKIEPNDGSWYHNRGMTLLQIGDIDGFLHDYLKLAELCRSGVEEFAHYYPEVNQVAWLRATFPEARYRNGQQAVELATKVCEYCKWKQWEYLATLAAAYAEAGDFPSAIKWAEESLAKAPEKEQAKARERLALYQTLKPYRDPEGYNTIAWTKATCRNDRYRDGKKAVEMATTACQLSDWRNWQYLDTLAAACAEAGDFKSAIEWQGKSLELTPKDSKQDVASRLELYRSGQPYREPERD